MRIMAIIQMRHSASMVWSVHAEEDLNCASAVPFILERADSRFRMPECGMALIATLGDALLVSDAGFFLGTMYWLWRNWIMEKFWETA